MPDGRVVFLTFWPAHYVPTDACAWQGALVQIDPTAEAFVDAMTAQTSTVSTPPVEVMVGDYSGFEFDHAAESDVDITDCDGGKLCIYSDSAQDCNGRGYSNCGRARNLPSGRPERRARCDRGGPIRRIDRSGADRKRHAPSSTRSSSSDPTSDGRPGPRRQR